MHKRLALKNIKIYIKTAAATPPNQPKHVAAVLM